MKKIAKISAATLARRFRDRNRRFLALPKDKQIIRIVKDVIAHVEANKLTPKKGIYLKPNKDLYSGDDDLREVLEETPKCEVCAIGGLLTSAVLLKNQVKVKNIFYYDSSTKEYYYGNENRMKSYLSTWFDEEQLYLIELAFEGNPSIFQPGVRYKIKSETYLAALRFGKPYRSAKKKLVAICENILKNKGKFVP